MTSFVKKNAQSAVSITANKFNKSIAQCHLQDKKNVDSLQAEVIEVIPELPFDNNNNDSNDGYSEFSDELNDIKNPFNNNGSDEDDESFDEYGKNKILSQIPMIYLLHPFS